jgi:2-octaprenyl-6-methoxyphenol hydroxylase
MMNKKRANKLCIVGGGLVGLAAAIALSRQGRKVVLLEARDYPAAQAQQHELDARSIALSYSSEQILRALGLWDSIRQSAAPIRDIHVSSAGHFGVTRLHSGELGVDAMGQVIEYDPLLFALLAAAQQDDNIKLIMPAEVESLQQQGDSVTLKYRFKNKSHSLTASVLMVADGANSTLRGMLGIDAEVVDYHQSAIIANLKIQQPPNDCAYERFTSHGPMALLPLPQQRYALVWTNPPPRTEQLLQLSDEEFLQEIHRQFGYRLGYFSAVGKRARFDLKRTRARQLVAGRAVLVGNAANTLHPVAGQGFNLALRDVARLHDVLAETDWQSDGLVQTLQQYQRERVQDQDRVIKAGDGLVKLFSNDWPVLNHARAGALAVLDLCAPLKHELGWQGMGYGVGCSSLMRGVQAE